MAELLKEAIADAKAVREVALQNAKMALEEAFDSKIKHMLSARLAEELEEDVELEEEYIEEEAEATDEGASYDEDDKVDEMSYNEDDVDEEINLDELMAELEEMSYEEDDIDEGKKDDEDVKEGKKDDDLDEAKKDDEDLKEGEQLDEMVGLAVVGSLIAAAGGIEAFLSKGRAGALSGKAEAIYQAIEGMASGAGAARRSEGVEESIDIDALISEIEADLEEGKKKDDEDVKEGKKKDEELDEAKRKKEKAEKELEEALATVSTLQETISEMNLLNSKLLYCNKLFRANALTEAQKVKVVDALDKSTTTGEAKLVFETLQESFNFTGVEKRAIKEGLARASKPAGTAPKKVLAESVDETVSRFQKLANINK